MYVTTEDMLPVVARLVLVFAWLLVLLKPCCGGKYIVRSIRIH